MAKHKSKNMKNLIEKYSELPKDSLKWILVTFTFGYLPFLLIEVILTLLNVFPVNFNNQATYGITGAIVAICFAPFIIFFLAILTWLYLLWGNIILKLIKKIL